MLKSKIMNLKEKTVVINDKTHRYSKIVMLPVNVSKRYNCTQGLIVKCIKEWTPIGESKREINKLSISKNWSQGVLEYYEPQHLYFLSNEEIKEGDYFYNDLFNMVDQLIKGGLVTDDLIQTLNENKHNRKIIATTDISLGLPQPSQSFIQAYIKAYNENKPITKVLVEMEVHTWQDVKGIEQACSLKVNSSNEITIKKVKDSYTREELPSILQSYLDYCHFSEYITPMKWLEENL